MKRSIFSAWIIGLTMALACAAVWAQATAQISGTAKDQSGAVLPGVEITVTQTDTGISRNTITNETGSYVLPNLAIGPYRLEASLPGFRSYVQTGIVLQVNSSPAINVVLEIGQVAETVEVQANAAMVETRSSTLGSVIENERILELPLNGRDVTELITLAGAAVRQSEGRGLTLVGTDNSPQIAVAGGAGWGVNYSLDGANHGSIMTGSTMAMPFPDAMQEFRVETSGATAQSGSSTAVAGVTKSGTNAFHGTLFEFVRNDLFNARSYFAAENSTLKRNQFGGTVGGPIVQNKLFFFGGYQRTTLRQDPADTRVFIQTPAILAGDWTAFASPACNNGRQINLSAPFVNNRIDPALYSKPALYVVRRQVPPLPFPISNNPCGEFSYGDMDATNIAQYVGKIDYQTSAKHSLFGRVLLHQDDRLNPQKFNTQALQFTAWKSALQSSYALGSTYLISANTVQAFRLGVNRSALNFYNTKDFNWCDAGMKIYCAPEITRILSLSVSGAFSYGTGSGNFQTGHKYMGTAYSVNDDVSLVRGAHQISFGASIKHGRVNTYSSWASSTRTSFNGSATGLGLADFLLGRPSAMTLARSNPHHANDTLIGAYAADTWRAKPNLTLNLGVRWEPYIPQNAEAIYNFDYDRFRQGIRSSVFLNAPAGFYYRGDPGFPKNGIYAEWLYFSPRIGMAWDVSGDGRSSVRGSYAFSYLPIPGDYREYQAGGPPWGSRVELTSPQGGLEDPWRGVPGGNIFPYEIDKNAAFPGFGLYFTQPYELRSPYSQSWNLAVQRQVGQDWLASASYMGSNTIHAWTKRAINPAIYFPGVFDANGNCSAAGLVLRGGRPGTACSALGNTDQRRRLALVDPAEGPKMGIMAEADDGATSTYHGMLFSVQRRAASGVTVSSNYTWSHCIGDDASLYAPNLGHPTSTYTDPSNRRFDRGNCEADRRHVFNLTTVAETPQFSNLTLRVLATGWRLSGIYRYSAGSPLDIGAGSDRALNGISGQRANQILANPFSDRSAGPLASYLNAAAFAQPDVGTLGRVGKNSIQGPGSWSLDAAVSRVFRFRESQRLEFRGEAYNLTNSFRPGNPETNLRSLNTFGVIRTSLDPRILQFALKYVF